jgi:hypothetical protein
MELSTLVITAACLAALVFVSRLRSGTRNAWRTLAQRHAAPEGLDGPEFRLSWCWFGARMPVYRNSFRARIADTGIRLSGIGPWGWSRPPLLLPWSAVRSFGVDGPLQLGQHDLLLELDGVALGLTFPRSAIPVLARHGVVSRGA